jgi:hypothetical protein
VGIPKEKITTIKKYKKMPYYSIKNGNKLGVTGKAIGP